MNSMPARHASSCLANSGWAAKAAGDRGATGLEVGHIAVQDARQLGGGVERWHNLRIAAVGVACLICRRVEFWLGHDAGRFLERRSGVNLKTSPSPYDHRAESQTNVTTKIRGSSPTARLACEGKHADPKNSEGRHQRSSPATGGDFRSVGGGQDRAAAVANILIRNVSITGISRVIGSLTPAAMTQIDGYFKAAHTEPVIACRQGQHGTINHVERQLTGSSTDSARIWALSGGHSSWSAPPGSAPYGRVSI